MLLFTTDPLYMLQYFFAGQIFFWGLLQNLYLNLDHNMQVHQAWAWKWNHSRPTSESNKCTTGFCILHHHNMNIYNHQHHHYQYMIIIMVIIMTIIVIIK